MSKKTTLKAKSYELSAKSNSGMIYVFTGDGKGKTSAALGTAMRAVGVGLRVAWVAFYKQESWGMGEVKSLRDLGVEVWLMGKGFHISSQKPVVSSRGDDVKMAPVGSKGNVVVDTASEDEHRVAAKEALEMAKSLFDGNSKLEVLNSKQITNPKFQKIGVDLLVLDEVNNAVAEGLIEVQEVLEVLEVRGGTHVVLTGRDVDPAVVEVADLVTECVKIKHPYDEGKLAVRGLDF